MQKIGNENDFKYVLQDFSSIYIGMRLTYQELADADDTPSRLKTAIYMYIATETPENTRLCDHVLSLEKGSRAYLVFSQLKGKFRAMIPVKVTDRKGRIHTEYREKIFTAEQLVSEEGLREMINPEYMIEYKFSKLHLGALSV